MKTKPKFLFLIVVVALLQLAACAPFLTKPIPTEPYPSNVPDSISTVSSVPTASAETRLMQADMLIQQGKCAEAMPILNELMERQPDWDLPYERHGMCIVGFQSNVFTERQGYLLAALHDANKLVALDPTVGGYYAWRNYVLREIAALELYSANEFAIYDLANQDVVKAVKLGVDPSRYAYRHYARNLIEGNHCQEGLAETQKLIDQTTTHSMEYGQYYSLYRTEAYICLGKLEEALESAQAITCDNPGSACRTGLIAEIYFQLGEDEKALETLNDMIAFQSTGGGWRYFIRALIEYKRGEKELASKDLEYGDANIWSEDGVYWYVKAKFAMDAGDQETGIQYLQTAEQTLNVTYAPFRQQIIRELKTYGAKPIPREPDLPFSVPLAP